MDNENKINQACDIIRVTGGETPSGSLKLTREEAWKILVKICMHTPISLNQLVDGLAHGEEIKTSEQLCKEAIESLKSE